ncbi:MAG: molybdopterin-dependent oxidoreductase [Streptosporangiales bacterium]|nr:molybdopterin-dependent oxidoreductase [Streptosporangiales bacterium]
MIRRSRVRAPPAPHTLTCGTCSRWCHRHPFGPFRVAIQGAAARVHDCGNMINPMVVEGQIAGGVAQGVGGAFYEHLDYDELGNLRNASFMDFLMPYATEVPHLEMHHIETPSPLNPIGAKGVGEAGTIPVGAVFASAVQDALAPLDIAPLHRVPMSPELIHAHLRAARGR